MKARTDFYTASPDALKAMIALETAVSKLPLEKTLIELVKLRASQINGCAFCIDMHWRDLVQLGADPRHLNALAGWREAPFFSERERAALRWAEIINATPHADASDEEFALLRAQFSEQEVAELGFAIATINAWNLLNVGFRNPVPEV